MGVREKGNADYEKGYRKGYQSGFQSGRRIINKKVKVKNFSDLEEVVRCANCTWNERNIDGVSEDWCTYFGKDIEDNAYCSYGEELE